MQTEILNLNPSDLQNLTRQELNELLALTSQWALPKETKFSVYVPNPILKLFHASEAKTRGVFGGNRSGKTFALVIEAAMQFTGRVPKSLEGLIPPHRLDPSRRLRLCTVDYPNNFTKVIWPYIATLIHPDDIADVSRDSGRIRAITNKKGGFIEFMMYESEVSKFQGSSRHAILYDEEPPEEIRDENLMRLVDTDGEEMFAMTPINEANYGCSSPWVFDKLFSMAHRVTELERGEFISTTNPEGDINTECFFANIFDNQAISPVAAERILSKFGDEERLVRQSGKFLFLSGLVYKEFNEKHHLIEPFDDWYRGSHKDDYTLYIAIDPHPRTPHNALFICARRDGLLFVVDELFTRTTGAKELVEFIQAKQMGKTANVILIDPLALTPDPSTGSCLAWDLAEAGLVPVPIEATKDKARGIIKVREALSDKHIFVNRELKNFRYEITHYVWDNWTKSTAGKKGEKQKPIDRADHAMENLYRLMLLDPRWVPPYNEEDEIDDILRRRRMTG